MHGSLHSNDLMACLYHVDVLHVREDDFTVKRKSRYLGIQKLEMSSLICPISQEQPTNLNVFLDVDRCCMLE